MGKGDGIVIGEEDNLSLEEIEGERGEIEGERFDRWNLRGVSNCDLTYITLLG